MVHGWYVVKVSQKLEGRRQRVTSYRVASVNPETLQQEQATRPMYRTEIVSKLPDGLYWLYVPIAETLMGGRGGAKSIEDLKKYLLGRTKTVHDRLNSLEKEVRKLK